MSTRKWVYPACKGRRRMLAREGTPSATTRAGSHALSADGPRGEFRLLAQHSRSRRLLGYPRQLPHDETVIEFTGNTMSDLAICRHRRFQMVPNRTASASCLGPTAGHYSGKRSTLREVAMYGREMVGIEGRQRALRGNCCRHSRSRRCFCIWVWADYGRLADEIAAARRVT